MLIGNINQVIAAAPVYQQNLRVMAARLAQHFGAEYSARSQELLKKIDLGSMAAALLAPSPA